MNTLNSMLRSIPLATMVVVALIALFGALTYAALYPPFVGAQTKSSHPTHDATLSALTVNDGTSDVALNPGFTSAGMSYRTAVKYRDERLTVTATTTAINATIAFLDRSDAILDDLDTATVGHQVDVPVGDLMFKIKVTAEDKTELVYEVTVERNDAHLFGWTPTRDLNGLTAAGNDNPQGIWSNGTTMWVADDDDDKLYAYALATGARDTTKEFDLHGDNGSPKGIWSDKTTVWVVDDLDNKLYAYTLATGARDSGKDIILDPANGAPWGIWSDGTIIWVTNDNDLRLYAYTLDGGTRQTDIEFLLSGNSRDPRGIWSDGSTLWVSSSTFDANKPPVAHTLDFSSNNGGTTHTVGNLHGLPDWGKSFYTPGTLQLMGAGIWSDGDTAIWMASTGPAGKIYSFNTLPSQAGGVSLSSLTVNDGTNNVGLLPGFNLKDVVYWTSVANDVNVVTVSATASNSAATVEYVNEDADSASGHQVDVAEGTTLIGILVTAPDGAALIHQVYVERDSSRFGGWTPTKDIHGLVADGITQPTGIWSDNTTMWVVDYRDFKLYAYTLATGARNEDKEFDLDPANDTPHGLWSDGTTIWVGNRSTANLKLFAYTLEDATATTGTDEKGQRDPTKDILLDALNNAASGIWSNGTDTVWVAEQIEDKLYAYTLDIGSDGMAGTNHGMRKTDSDIPLQGPAEHWGIWSDGTTMWEGNNSANSIRAYRLATGYREESKDIPFAPYQSNTWGIWSDGSTLWTVNGVSQRLPYVYTRIFSHTLPASGGATTLSNLTVTPFPAVSSFTATLRPTFSSITNSYGVAVPNAAEFVTISPTLSDNAATAAYQDEDGVTLADADQTEAGRQVRVPVGTFVINIVITKTGEPSITYTVHVERDSAERFGWTPTKDLNTFYQDNPEAAGQVIRGVWGDGMTLYVTPHNTAKVFAFDPTDGTRIATKDIVTTSDFVINSLGRHAPIIFAGIWSDGTTMWVVDYVRVHNADGEDLEDQGTPPRRYGKLFAYGLMDGERDKTKEFVLDPIHDASVRGVWSNGTTLWVSDYKLGKLIAYHLKDNPGTQDVEVLGTRDVDKDIVLHSDNDVAQGIWSDGTTIWVVQFGSPKFFAYTLATGVRDTDKEFDRVPGNHFPRDIWSDGTTLYVPDHYGQKLFSYTMTDGTTTTDTPGVTVIPTVLTVTEEDTAGASYTVVLDSQPTAGVTVTVAGHSGTDVTTSPATLTFTTSNWGTPQTVTVTAGDDADTTDDEVTLTHSAASADGNYNSITIDDVAVTVNDNTPANVAPTFDEGASTSRDFNETIGDEAVATLADIGNSVAATDSGDTLTYSLEGTDMAKFGIVRTSGQLQTKVGEKYSHEAKSSYSVTVKVVDSQGASDTIAVTLNVMDQNEPPLAPNAPPVSATPGSNNSLDVSWTAPTNTGRPAITNYDLQYQVQGASSWTNGPRNVTNTSTSIPNLDSDTSYQVQVRARNAEGADAWSASGTGRTDTPTAPGVSVLPTVLTVTEEDTAGASYTVVLDSQPTADVTVTVAGHSGTEVTPTPTSLTFTTSNWESAQTITVTATDTVTMNDTVTLTHSAASMDTEYNGITIDSVAVTVNDIAVGICGRTKEVRDALVDLIPGVSGCAAVTADDLAAITGTLDLSGQSIADLAAGDFAGLTSLMELYLDNNKLPELPDDVFAGLTSLEVLYLNNNDLTELSGGVFEPLTSLEDLTLNNNDLTTLPGGVFDQLTMLKVLTLYYNALTMLPDGVFELLTRLNFLYMEDNPGVPFAPTADARPDAGRVAVDGGTVRLDGSGSGGPWGTNVSYSWALTTPASGVTFDDATSVTPEVTIPELAADTELTFTLTVTGRGHIGSGTATATATAKVTATLNITNNPPVFAGGTAQVRILAETLGDAAVTTASDIGAPVSATDTDTGDTLTYVLLGADRDKFTFDTSSGQIKTKSGESYDYEAQSSYSVRVAVIDGTVTVSSAVTINVTDQDEPPPVMNQPVVTATANATTSLEVSWTEPSNPGRPDIESYDLQYRAGNTGGFSNGPQDKTGSSAAIGNLTADTSYEVRVRATNAEGDGVWSPSGTGQTNAEDNAAPTFDEGGSTTRTFNETIGDSTVGTAADIGTPVSATDPDTGDTLEYRLEGTDRTKFGINATSGQIRTKVGESYDYEARTSYSVRVAVNDGTVTVSSTVTINVTDQDEPPPVMNQPVVTATANATTSLEVSWTEPSNPGRPDIESYDLQYRAGSTGGFSNGPQDETGSSAAIGNLTADTSYEVRVRATNAEGDGVWSPSGTGTTGRTTITTDPPGVTVSPTALTVTEEDPTGESYRVVLDSQPTAEVVVTVAGHAGTEVTPSPTSLTFTRSNWETGQMVTVTAGSDADTVNDTVTLTHSAASRDSDYDGNSITIASVAVTVTDDDIDTTAAGICGRTEEVRDALLAQIPGVSDCAAVTDADLAAITGPLDLSGQNITELAAGDFAGLTGLIELYLNNNKLTTLRGDVFAGLPVLKVLTLYYNELDTLPDGVFGQLTALNFLYLGDNPRAPFAPTAVALPDAGTVPVAGGTVTLDGSGSGGPWGTNVTYAWALTTPASGVRVTFDDATSVTPEVTIPTLAAGTELTFTLTVTGRGGTDGIETATASARVTATQNITNNPPVFAGGAVQARTFNETIGDATVGTAADIGTPVSATDPDTGDTLEYSLLGADRDKFTFDTSSGQIKTRAGENYDYEARTSYSVTVAVIDGTVTVSSTVTINVTDQDEPPPVMNQPVVTATANATTSLEVSWTEPSNPGRPDIESYDLQYRVGSTGGFSNGPQDETGSSAAIGNLTADTSYEVRVRATNAEGDGVWSPSGTGTTGRTTITTDPPGVTVSETALTVTEEDPTGESYRVVLDSQPTAEVVVTVAGHAGTEVTPSPTSLTFTRSNWDTAQTVTVTAGSDADTENDTVTLTHSAASADSDYDGNSITIASVTVTVTDNDTGNAAPTFDEGGSTTRTFNETIGDEAVATLADIGNSVAATDSGDTLTYSLEGTDMAKFGIVRTSGQLQTKVGEKYSHEAKSSYSVTVKVVDSQGASDTIAVTLNVMDQNEPPLAPNAPSVSATPGSNNSLDVSWTAPTNTGRPAITNYDLQYQVQGASSWTNGPRNVTNTSTSIPNLDSDTSYQVQVRARNAEGADAWSASGTGRTDTPTAPGVSVLPTVLTVTEEDTAGASYTVVLDSQPTAEVVVTVAGHAGTEVTPSPTSLTFTRSNWETDQTVTVTAGDDADTVNDTVTLTHSAASTDSDYDGNSITIASVAVTVTDDDIDTTAAGICGRTEEVRDALLAQIPGVSDCAAVTAAQLAAITGPLDLSGQNITELAAGDFAGLTGLIELYLNNNKLTTLRGDVFAGLTALTQLQLNNNELETLPKDVFAGLPVLKVLTLYDNDLEKLPDGVFEPLTALAYLGLYGNPGAPFAPTAVALPDAGTVPVAGGTVTLDGSGSGPWGTNVTYRWALTTPASGVRVTFDDSTSATPEATIPTLAAGTELTFTLTVTGLGGTQGTAPGTDTATVTATDSVTASTDATLGPLRVNDGTREVTVQT